FLWFMFGGHTPAHVFVLPLVIAALHPTGDPRGRGFRFIGALGVAFVTLALGSMDSASHNRMAGNFLRHDLIFSAVTAGLASGLSSAPANAKTAMQLGSASWPYSLSARAYSAA
ncbi:MAG: hypothetical protein RL309_1219, partial [Verrucomicrobiota bacterium]